MSQATVRVRGTDSSGRPIMASDYMWVWWEALVVILGFRPTITQGAWMSRVPGGGAPDSVGYHDFGGCFDLRVWDLTPKQIIRVIFHARRCGAAIWLRNLVHGGFSDPHLHLVLGSDPHLSMGAEAQWLDYTLEGGDGMGGRDYHPRPNPIVTEPPEEMHMPSAQEIAKEMWGTTLNEYDADTEGETAPARLLLSQAHNRAGRAVTVAAEARQAATDARTAAADARKAAVRTERAIKALAKGFPADVQAAVEAALTEAVIDVDVTVSVPTDPDTTT